MDERRTDFTQVSASLQGIRVWSSLLMGMAALSSLILASIRCVDYYQQAQMCMRLIDECKEFKEDGVSLQIDLAASIIKFVLDNILAVIFLKIFKFYVNIQMENNRG